MPRVSNADQRLIQTALEMAHHSSLSGLKLRDVAKKAGVNLGMFHYHFKTKDAFIRRVLQEAYDRFFKEFTLETSKEGPARERLRSALLALGRFARENRRLLLGIMHGALNKEREVLDFAAKNLPRHGRVMMDLASQSQKEGSMRKMPFATIMPLFIGAVGLPNMMLAMMEYLDVKVVKFIPDLVLEKVLLSDRLLEERVDLVLEALAPKKGGKR